MVNSLEEAISLTMKIHGYSNDVIPEMLERIKKKDYSVITSKNGARDYVSSLSKEELEYQINGKKQINQDNTQEQELIDIDYVIENIMETYNINSDEPRLKEILTDQLIKIFVGQINWQLKDGKNFTSKELIDMMTQKCIEAGKERFGNAGILYQKTPSDSIESFDEVAFISSSYINNPDVIRNAILTNPTFSGNVIGNLVEGTLSKKQNKDADLGQVRNQMNVIIQGINLNCAQKADLFFNQITGKNAYYGNINPNLINELSELSPEKMKLVILINSINLNELGMHKNTIDDELISMYSGGRNLSFEQIKMLKEKNNSVLFELYNAYEKYGIDGLGQYINSISSQDLEILCNLYVNSNSNTRNQQLMDVASTYCTNSEIINLRNKLASSELYENLKENIGKSY